MFSHFSVCPNLRIGRRTMSLALAATLMGGFSIKPAAAQFLQTNLVSDIAGLAKLKDAHLINPWGTSSSATSPLWVSNAGTSTSTLYNINGTTGAITLNPLVVTTPAPISGQVFNGGSGFVVTNGASGAARFIFAGLNGQISGWSPTVPAAGSTQATVGATGAPPAAYTGMALVTTGGNQFLFAANAAGNRVDVYNSSFAPVSLSGNFADPTLPAGNRPFNVVNIGGRIFVTYEGPDGIVNEFDTNGNFVKRFATGGGLLNPWGMALAPANFGGLSGALLIGSFNRGLAANGPGWISAYDPLTGSFLGRLTDSDGNPIEVDGLWSLQFGNGGNGGVKNRLYFTAGIQGEQHGLLGSIQAVPEPGVYALLSAGILPALLMLRRKKA